MLEKVDETIEAVCDWVQRACKAEALLPDDKTLPEMVSALAELVSTRATNTVSCFGDKQGMQAQKLTKNMRTT